MARLPTQSLFFSPTVKACHLLQRTRHSPLRRKKKCLLPTADGPTFGAQGTTTLSLAALENQQAAAKQLVEKGADINTKNMVRA
jgi:ankyrin repeat protein